LETTNKRAFDAEGPALARAFCAASGHFSKVVIKRYLFQLAFAGDAVQITN